MNIRTTILIEEVTEMTQGEVEGTETIPEIEIMEMIREVSTGTTCTEMDLKTNRLTIKMKIMISEEIKLLIEMMSVVVQEVIEIKIFPIKTIRE